MTTNTAFGLKFARDGIMFFNISVFLFTTSSRVSSFTGRTPAQIATTFELLVTQKSTKKIFLRLK